MTESELVVQKEPVMDLVNCCVVIPDKLWKGNLKGQVFKWAFISVKQDLQGLERTERPVGQWPVSLKINKAIFEIYGTLLKFNVPRTFNHTLIVDIYYKMDCFYFKCI